ncbi:transglycosylase domain-containing protein [Leucobacter sp. cx-42]|uniref:transglycosylase domain-containing protein n=1 Tax=unclassified Leucobacter TaxID=2621730 RepID=UPI00165DF0AF|nr:MULTISPECIES: transglycosylase domain-containing protein [unclassified Leucobacter]MBC9955089.1 transglycosylase domain-containing protein [Leucobacter sp. cx-42]
MTQPRPTKTRAKSSRARTVSASGGRKISGLFGAIAMSVVAGVLVAAAVTPVVAVSGFAASSAVSLFENLPEHIDPGTLPQPSTIYAKNPNVEGGLEKVADFYSQDREVVEWDQISQYVKDAVVSEEDPRFYTHGGVDVLAASRAVLQNAAGSGFSGASTVTMQYVRNVLIQESLAHADEADREAAYEDAMEQTVERKLKEMRYAISIEKKNSKDQILLGYLNIALFGNRVYGIESAAHYYFNTTAKDLTLPQAASLAAIVNAPNALAIDDPDNIEANKERRDLMLHSMYKHGRISEKQYEEAIATPVEPHITPRVAGCSAAEAKGMGSFCNYVQRYIQNDPSFGATQQERDYNFNRGGWQIISTVNPELQAAATSAVRDNVPSTEEGISLGATAVSVEVKTGKVLAMTQNRPFSEDPDVLNSNPGYTSINYNTDYDYGGSGGFQVGSTFKPITLAEWIRTGHSVRDRVNVSARSVEFSSFRAKCMPDGVYGYGSFSFQNDDNRYNGGQQVLTATQWSVNGGFISMQQEMDLCDTFDLAEKLGVHRAAPMTNEDLENYGTTNLTRVPSGVFAGVDEVAPVTMANAYAAFAGDGTVCDAVPIEKITDPEGNEVKFTGGNCREAISPEVAAGVAYALEATVNGGLASSAQSYMGIPHLGKTGSTDDYVDTWLIAASSRVSTAVWVGNVEGKVSLIPYGYNNSRHSIMPRILEVADRVYGGEAFPEPSESAIRQTSVNVPDVTGKSVEEATKILEAQGFTVADGGDTDSELARGLVARTDPGAGGEAWMGATITLYKSSGNMTKVPDGLTGVTGSVAAERLAAVSLNADFQCETGKKEDPDKNKVVSADPGSGTAVKGGSTVKLKLACGAD